MCVCRALIKRSWRASRSTLRQKDRSKWTTPIQMMILIEEEKSELFNHSVHTEPRQLQYKFEIELLSTALCVFFSMSFMSDFDIMLARKKAQGGKRRRNRDGGTFISDADDVVSAMITKMTEAAEVCLHCLCPCGVKA